MARLATKQPKIVFDPQGKTQKRFVTGIELQELLGGTVSSWWQTGKTKYTRIYTTYSDSSFVFDGTFFWLRRDWHGGLRENPPAGAFVEAVPACLDKLQSRLLKVKPLRGIPQVSKVGVLLKNGDDSVRLPFDNLSNLSAAARSYVSNTPTCSFICIQRLLAPAGKTPRRYMRELIKGSTLTALRKRVQLLDFEPDVTIQLTPAAKKHWELARKLGNKANLRPPQLGLTLMGTSTTRAPYWHRASTVLFVDRQTKKHYLIGQDEGTYFGCELAGKPETIQKAFLDLMPPQVIASQERHRQGEWFLIPTKADDVPSVNERAASIEIQGTYVSPSVTLPRESTESARHILYASELVIGTDGAIYARRPRLEHSNGDHAALTLEEGWYKTYRNTAVRSVSVEGVD